MATTTNRSAAAQPTSKRAESLTVIRSPSEELRCDAVMSREHERSSQLTDAPIEDGSVTTDHIILDPIPFTLQGLVSDDPIDKAASEAAASAAQTRSEAAAALLERWWSDKTLLTITTPKRIYRNMAITRLSWQETADVGAALAFTLAVREIRKATLQTVAIEKLAPATADLAAPKVNRGRQHGRTPRGGKNSVGALGDAAERAGVTTRSAYEGVIDGLDNGQDLTQEIDWSETFNTPVRARTRPTDADITEDINMSIWDDMRTR